MQKILKLSWVVASGFLLPVVTTSAQSPGERGHQLAKELCSPCHAIAKTGTSPNAAAPAFRRLGNSFDLDGFPRRLQRGLNPGHADMPAFKFNEDDARAIAAYLRSIQE